MLEELEPSAAEVLRVCDQLIRNKQQEALTTMAAAIAKYPNNRDLRLLQLQTLLDQRDFTGALTACAAASAPAAHEGVAIAILRSLPARSGHKAGGPALGAGGRGGGGE